MTKYFLRYTLTGNALMFPKLAHCSAYVLVADDEATLFGSMTEAITKALENGLRPREFAVEMTSVEPLRTASVIP